MTRLVLASIVLAAAFWVAAGLQAAPAGGARAPLLDLPALCASKPDGGTRPAPHGLLMVAERNTALPCARGG